MSANLYAASENFRPGLESGSEAHSLSIGFSYYATTKSLTPEFYQGLVNRGWRRSGSLLYKPDLRVSCCPHYTIRVDTQAFQATKDQRQTLNRFTTYVLGQEYIRDAARYYPKSRQEALKRKQVFDIVERVREPERETLDATAAEFMNTIKRSRPAEPLRPSHTFTVNLEPATFSEEKYALFENYQRIVHKEGPDRTSRRSFMSFLCSSPIQTSCSCWENGRMIERKVGSYHQCYRLDGKLVAVGVLDLLPQSVSAVYFMYTQDVNRWNFGKLGALREVAMALEGGYRYYYMGFYIHSCIKMRYKGAYYPQYILDPETYSWDLFDADLRRKMDEREYVCLSEEREREARGEKLQSDAKLKHGKENGVNTGEMDAEDGDETSRASSSPTLTSSSPPSMPLWARNMPGIMSVTELLRPPTQYSLDLIKILVQQRPAVASDLLGWDTGSVADVDSLKGFIADLVAAVGWDLAVKMVVYFE